MRGRKFFGGDRRSWRIGACDEIVVAALGAVGNHTVDEARQAPNAQGLAFGFRTMQCFVPGQQRRFDHRRLHALLNGEGHILKRERPGSTIAENGRLRPQA
jgi:hypothetical protein